MDVHVVQVHVCMCMCVCSLCVSALCIRAVYPLCVSVQAQPVLLVDMPSSGGGAPNDAKAALEEAALVRRPYFTHRITHCFTPC